MSHSTETLFVRIRRTASSDLLLGLLVALAIDYVVLTMDIGVLATTVVVLPLFLFVPGYTVLAALFPSTGSTAQVSTLRGAREMRATGIDLVERVVLSYGLSLVLFAALGVALPLTPFGLTRESVFLGLTLVVVLAVPLAVVRRSALPAERQFELPLAEWFGDLRAWFGAGTATDSLVNLALAVCVVGAVAAVGFAVLAPPAASEYTQVSLMTEGESGELVAGGMPDEVTVGEEVPVVLQVENYGSEASSYTVVVQLQRVAENGAVTERQELDRFSGQAAAGGDWQQRHTVAAPTTGERLRVTYLVYEGQAPENPTQANADVKPSYFWLTVSDGSN